MFFANSSKMKLVCKTVIRLHTHQSQHSGNIQKGKKRNFCLIIQRNLLFFISFFFLYRNVQLIWDFFVVFPSSEYALDFMSFYGPIKCECVLEGGISLVMVQRGLKPFTLLCARQKYFLQAVSKNSPSLNGCLQSKLYLNGMSMVVMSNLNRLSPLMFSSVKQFGLSTVKHNL